MPPRPTSLARRLAASLLPALCACDGGLPAPDPVAAAIGAPRPNPARPDAHFGLDLLFRQGDAEASATVAGAPVAAPAEAMAHDLALWTFTTAGGRLADVVPVDALALVAIAAPPPEADPVAGDATPPPLAPQTAHGLSREAWRLELWRPPAGEAPATLLGLALERSLTAGPPTLAPALRDDRDAPNLAGGRDGGLALWIDDGTLTARPLSLHPDAAGDPARPVIEPRADRLAYMSTETHRLVGVPVVTLASRDPSRRYFVCARENVAGLVCAFMSRDGEVEAWTPVPGLASHAPRALTRVEGGFIGLALGCRGDDREGVHPAPEDCPVASAASFHLDVEGLPRGKRALVQLGQLASQRPMVIVETGDGLLVSARKVRPDGPGVWHLTGEGARPRDDNLGRLLGGVRLTPGGAGTEEDDGLADEAGGSEVWLLDASPLVMRDGFPVALPRPARWSPQLGREPHVAWPARIAAALPGHRGQPVRARERFLAFSHAPRADTLTITCLHFEPNGSPPSPPERPARGDGKRPRKKSR